ncbi:MAG: glycerol-3-phosphate acyltransferase [Candidatus Cloacimonetes bacterium]|nr:glycerol-3-phosphate acyltransferase [Candidatus Cloacimonadota bacterium]
MIVIIAILIFLLAYLYGGFSTARLIAKGFRSLNVYKIGTGLADTENIYTNISHPLGILVGALDMVKAFVFLQLVRFILSLIDPVSAIPSFELLYSNSMMLVYGLGMLVGHCLPWQNHFRGGRGIFTYMGFFAYFSFWPIFITVILAWILVVRFHQIRFAQYLIVLLPVVLFQVFYYLIPQFRPELPPFFVIIMWGNAIIMGVLNFLVSKRLGEL